MRDRAFGVEIECGTSGGYDREDYCRCECDCYECSFCRYGCEESLGEDEECSCECVCEECDYCRSDCECECEPPYGSYACERAADILHSAGLGDWTDEIHEDGSGCEIPSPILRGAEGLDQLRRVLKLLNDNGFDCTHLDGAHVHHDAPEFVEDADLIGHIVELWAVNQLSIDRFVDESRRESRNGFCYRVREDSLARFKTDKQPDIFGRTCAINVTGLVLNGSIELRQHEGTLDFNEWASWIKFGQAFIDLAVRTYKKGEIVTCASASDLLRVTRTSPKATRLLMHKAAGRSLVNA